MKSVTLILPTYNEAETIEGVIDSIFTTVSKLDTWKFSVLVVDSESPDSTGAKVKSLQKKYKNLHLLTTKKEGLGKAYVHGFTYAMDELGADVLFEMDADFSHDPKLLTQFLERIDNGADFVVGSRYMKGGSIPSNWGFHRKLFSIVGNIVIRLGFMKLRITDWTSGYRAIRSWVVKDSLSYISHHTGYVFQVALLENALKLHAHVIEIPIKFIDREYGVSKLNSSQYIKNTLWYVFTHSSFVKYVIVGGSGFSIDFGISYVLIEKIHAHFPVWLATVVSAEIAIVWNFFWNNYWTFAHKRVEHKSMAFLKSLAKFNSVAVGSILIQAGIIELCVRAFGRSNWFIYKILVLGFIIIPYSYVLYNRVVWKGKKKTDK